MNIKLRSGLGSLLLLLALLGCQPRVWQASASLAQTDVPVDITLAPDPQTEAVIAPYRRQVTAKMGEVLGTAPAELLKGDYQSPLGNFVVDLMLEQTRKLYHQSVELAVTTNGGLRVPLPQGQIRMEHAFELMPFENELVVLTLDGPAVQELFDFAAARKIAPIGNATYTVQNGKATNIMIGGKPFSPTRTYTVVTSDYLAGGGDNMTMFANALKTDKVGVMLRDAIIQHIRELTAKGLPVTADTHNRVTVLP